MQGAQAYSLYTHILFSSLRPLATADLQFDFRRVSRRRGYVHKVRLPYIPKFDLIIDFKKEL